MTEAEKNRQLTKTHKYRNQTQNQAQDQSPPPDFNMIRQVDRLTIQVQLLELKVKVLYNNLDKVANEDKRKKAARSSRKKKPDNK